jgi:hypothetical protein
MNYDALFSNGPASLSKSSLGGIQNDIFFSVMKVIHRQPQPAPAPQSDNKVARVACVCRISELMPLVRQMHEDARARYQASLGEERQQAA